MKATYAFAILVALASVTVAVFSLVELSGQEAPGTETRPAKNTDTTVSGRTKASNHASKCSKIPPPGGTRKPWFDKSIIKNKLSSQSTLCLTFLKRLMHSSENSNPNPLAPNNSFFSTARELRINYLSCLQAAGRKEACSTNFKEGTARTKCLSKAVIYGLLMPHLALGRECPGELIEQCNSLGYGSICKALCNARTSGTAACNGITRMKDFCMALSTGDISRCSKGPGGHGCKEAFEIMAGIKQGKPAKDALWPGTGFLQGENGCKRLFQENAGKICSDASLFKFKGIPGKD
ncbi:MAG: hypothetical protein GXP49_05260 [Deltaproteobacteria bacterium]|nr:hypothetical protein [Deltaproteobacteria bacterium]